MKSGVVYCWGDNNDGELGDGTTANSRVAKAVSTLTSGVTAVSVGYGFACAIVGGASLECWGSNGSGQLGNGTEASSLVPTPVPGLGIVTAVSAGVLSTCAVDEGALYCWGDNSINELGNYAAGSSSSTPVAVPTLSTGVTEVAMGSDGSCAIANGGAWCWGTSGIGNAGYYNGTTTGPIPVTGLSSGVTAIAAGASSACAVQSGAVLCWGDNSSGQLGNGGVVDHLVATPVSGFP